MLVRSLVTILTLAALALPATASAQQRNDLAAKRATAIAVRAYAEAWNEEAEEVGEALIVSGNTESPPTILSYAVLACDLRHRSCRYTYDWSDNTRCLDHASLTWSGGWRATPLREWLDNERGCYALS